MLICENISKTYKSGGLFSKNIASKVLDNINFHLQSSRSAGFAGKNGAGKSTLMRIILGLEKADSGSIEFMGEKINHLPYKDLKNIYKEMQVVFQNPQNSINPAFTVFQAVSEPVTNFYKYPKHKLRSIVEEKLNQVGLLSDIMDTNITKLSGGQKQRTAIARALTLNPKLLILDEAVSSLDMVTQSQIISLLETLKKQYNMSYLVISHDIRVLLKLCDDIIFLEKGVIIDKFTKEKGINTQNQNIIDLLKI